MGGHQSLLAIMDFAYVGVLPLESSLLLGSLICILLDRLENSRSELSFEGSQGSFLLQRLDHNLLQIGHYKCF